MAMSPEELKSGVESFEKELEGAGEGVRQAYYSQGLGTVDPSTELGDPDDLEDLGASLGQFWCISGTIEEWKIRKFGIEKKTLNGLKYT